MPTTCVKICGITRPADAVLAAKHGADFLGLNFFKGPRKITFATATSIIHATPNPLPQWVGLVGDTELSASTSAEILAMRTVMDSCSHFQHYDSTAQIMDALNRLGSSSPFFKNIWIVAPVTSREYLLSLQGLVKSLPFIPAALLLDTASDKLGGTGQSFNWNWIAEARAAGELDGLPPIILAGGLTPDNVAEAIRIARPYAVDVSSGVEVPGKPGIKDPIKMRDFIQAAKTA